MIDPALLGRLSRIVGADGIAAGRHQAEVYSYDASLATGVPDAVVLPADTEQTAAVVRLAAEAGIPFVPRGFGTNLSGGSVAPRGGLVIGLARLNRILEMRPEGRYAVAQAGVTNLELQDALAPLGFYFAPDPASQKVATLGGNVGENSGGPHCLKYGVTTNHVLGMTLVLADGQVVRVGGPALDPPGYDLRGLVVGSEGTLAIITELVVRILPSPESVLTLLVVYDDVADAARSVSDITAAGIVPATLEMMDATVMRAVEESKPCGFPLDAVAVLIAEVDGPAVGLADQARRIGQICTANRCRQVRQAKDAAERDLLWAGRRGAFGAIARLAPSFLVADCTVPRTHLPEALARVATIAAKHELAHGNVFHAGDGNLHPLLLFDSRNADQVRRVHEAGREIMEACAALGGTITGEHGVGMEKADAMRLVFSEDDLEFQRRLRAAFDPRELLNPAKVLPAAIGSADSARPASPQLPLRGEYPGNEAPPGDKELRGDVELPGEVEFVPADVAEACEIVRRAGAQQRALAPCGNGTQWELGNWLDRPATPLRSLKLAAVVEHDPANQVVAIGAGMPLDALQDLLAGHGQWLPLRPPLQTKHTVGGTVALGACGPERLRYGAPRDLLLGLKFVSGTGRLIAAGGRVVKNVAGYDLTRLLAGSAGTLGLLTELTFRVLPLPQSCTAVVASGSLAQCGSAAAALLRSKLEPNFLVAVPAESSLRPGGDASWQLAAGFEGFRQTVDFQAESCRTLMEKAGLGRAAARDYAPREGICRGFFETLYQAPIVLRADLPPDRVAPLVSAHGELLRDWAVLVDLGCGRITAAASSFAERAWGEWCGIARKAGGHCVLEKVPEAVRRACDVFGPPREEWPIVQRIKAALDPQRVFAPGRLPGRK